MSIPNGICTSRGVGVYAASESHVAMYSNRYRADGTRPGVLYCHSHNNTAIEVAAYPWVDLALREVAKAGYPVLACDFGGATAWGNDTAIARVADGKTFLQGTLGAKAGGVFGYCFSMGAATFLNWARQNLSSVLAFAGACPAVNVEGLRAANTNGAQAEIETAYTNLAGWNAAKATHDPNLYAAELVGVPMKLWYGTADTAVPQAVVDSFAGAVGAGASTVPMPGLAHDPTGVDAQTLVSFFQAHG